PPRTCRRFRLQFPVLTERALRAIDNDVHCLPSVPSRHCCSCWVTGRGSRHSRRTGASQLRCHTRHVLHGFQLHSHHFPALRGVQDCPRPPGLQQVGDRVRLPTVFHNGLVGLKASLYSRDVPQRG